MVTIKQDYRDAETGKLIKTYEFSTGWESEAQARKAWRDRSNFVFFPDYVLDMGMVDCSARTLIEISFPRAA
jgi:hypothetical protein